MFNEPGSSDFESGKRPIRFNQAEPSDASKSGPWDAPLQPARFGRFAICVAAASALALGVVGTLAYGVWFNRDQQSYVDAIAAARQALRAPPSSPLEAVRAKSAALSSGASSAGSASSWSPDARAVNRQTGAGREQGVEADRRRAVWSGEVTPASPDANASNPAAEGATTQAGSAQNARSPQSAQSALAARPSRRGASADSTAQQTAAAHSGKEARSTQQDRRTAAANARRKDTLLARVSHFFQRVSYRQHGGANQQDLYSHP
ncbi:hypothetical protein AAGS40_19150 [Paraburkholderia sp. PREW-6R]|uniref:hypothetical protein n=1 Tax=Paraburkholderia sp. PREW-6R TaxID=3141544 RepID=UPI0031F56CD8